ncbi:MAG: RnfABCDGE type electron transport complex subunit A [Synergistaceae bacterium]|nr:RnfABCDGE type electron transport complex subunit A [Synergistaceae bacterium]
MNPFMVLIGAALVNNYVLTQFLGMCPFFGVSNKTETALGMGFAVLFVMTLASAITHPFYHYILVPLNAGYLQTVVFILIIASLVQFVEMFLKKSFRALYASLGIFLPMITTNCAIFGVTLINVKDPHSFTEAVVNSAGAGIGFLLALLLLAGVREKSDNNPDIPEIFKGFPLALFSAGLMSIALMGFQGLIKF